MNKHLRHFFRYQFPALGWALIIFIGSSIPARYFPSHTIFQYDKLIHIVLFMIFGILVYRMLEPYSGRNSYSWARIFFSISVVVLYGVMDEFHQGYVPGRSVDVWDAAADTFGGVLSAIIVYIFYHKRRIS